MQLLVAYETRSDEDLAALVGEGDRAALATLYDRHVDAIHDHVGRIIRDADGIADIVQTTFVKAWDGLRAGREPVTNVRAWLFTIARNAALDEVRRSRRVDVTDQAGFDPELVEWRRAADPAAAADDHEVVELVWAAADALGTDDYALLTLHTRHGLSADELSVVLGLTKGAVYTRLSRLRDAVEEAVACTLLVRHARRDCEALDQVVARLSENPGGPALRKAVRKHARGCDVCEGNRRRLASPLALLAAVPPLALPATVRERIWERIDGATTTSAAAGRSHLPRANGAAALVTALLTVVVAAIAIVAAVAHSDGEGRGGSGVPPPRDPADVRSVSHRPDRPSTDDRVVIAWTAQPDATAYSVQWDQLPQSLPDDVADLSGSATGTASDRLAPGQWWFHLRTRGADGRWTSTVHLGPFRIEAPPAPTAVTTTTTATVPPTTTSASTSTSSTTAAAPPATVLGVTLTPLPVPVPVSTPSTTALGNPPTTTTATTRPPTTTTTTTRPPTTTSSTTTTTAPTTTTTAFVVVLPGPVPDPTTSTSTTSTSSTTTTTTEPPAPGAMEDTVVDGDAKGSPVPRAVVTLLGTKATAATDELGLYRLEEIDAGVYDVEVAHPSFATAVVKGVEVSPGSTAVVDVVLQRLQNEVTRIGQPS